MGKMKSTYLDTILKEFEDKLWSNYTKSFEEQRIDIKSFIRQSLLDYDTHILEKIEKVFDKFRSSNQKVNGKRRFGVANFKVGARDLYDEILEEL